MKNKIVILMLAVLLTAGTGSLSFSASAESHPNRPAGDADGDGRVTISDATLIQKHLAELTELDELSVRAAKCNFKKEKLYISDVTAIQRKLAGYNDSRTCEVGKTAFVWNGEGYITATESFQKNTDDMMSRIGMSGVIYAERNGRTLCQSALGKADTLLNEDININTLFPIGSNSKQICAASIMLLQERGKLSTSDTIDKFFPEFAQGKNITVRNLLTMRSGIRDYINPDESYEGEENPITCYKVSEENTAAENKRSIIDWLFSQELKFAPDSKFSYSNSNFLLLSEIVGKVSGVEYYDFVKENIFKALGMTSSGFYDELVESVNLAEPNIDEQKPYEAYIKGLTQGAGDVVSNAPDMKLWMNSLIDGTLLSKESLDEMTADNIYHYGYGIGTSYSGALSHFGRISSYTSYVYISPKDKFCMFAVTNDSEGLMDNGTDFSTMIDRLRTTISK